MRISKNFNRDWTFRYTADPQSCPEWATAGEAEGWLGVAVPHTWSTYETTGHLHPFIRDAAETDDPTWWHGWGWYRKRFSVDESWRGHCFFLEFDGVQKYCRIYLNGTPIGEHKGGFTSFSVELTAHLRMGQENVLAVEVSNRRDDSFGGIPPMTAGNWNVYGGIYRDVRLVIKQPVHIPYQGNWEHDGGTFITTPTMQSVKIATWLRNTLDHPVEAEVSHRLLDPRSREVGFMSTTCQIAPGDIGAYTASCELSAETQLWSPETPAVYRALTSVRVGEQLVDQLSSPFGFRWFTWDYEERQLWLNGRRVKVQGTNRHQEYPWLGDAIPKWLHVTDLEDIRHGLGHNFLRACHYPQDPLVYDLTDRLGLIACEEVPNIKNIRFGDEIQRRNVIEMIRRDRNHPSILIWSMGNETNCAADAAWARAEDETRLIHFRHVSGRGEDEPHNSDQIDMENLLRCSIRGWTRDDGGHPNGQVAGSEVWQHAQARVAGGSIRGRIDQNNMVMWIYADHGADREYGKCPLKHLNPKGWVDSYRQPKTMYHLQRANSLAELVVHVHRRFWRGKYLGQRHEIQVDSNAEEIELWVNGRSVGRATPSAETFFTVSFPSVPIEAGTITAIARRGGDVVADTVHLAGAPAELRLSCTHEVLPADRAGVALIEVSAVDAQGHMCWHARPTLHWEIAGPGKLLGPDTWRSDISRHEAGEGTMYTILPIAMPVRTTAEPGVIVVRVSSPGLKGAEILLEGIPPEPELIPGIREVSVADGFLVRPVAVKRQASQPTIPIVYEDFHWSQDTFDGYWRRLDAYIRDAGVRVSSTSVRYEQLLNELSGLLVKHAGILIADDYNFAVERFNHEAS